jgi:UDP-N-acetylglucosamine 2-epimerase (non-hydrolysing)
MRNEILIDLIVGARPNFIKVSPVIDALRERERAGSRLRFRLIHTGQHYDRNMSGAFFEELGIPRPQVNLDVGSGTQAEQTGAIMIRYEKILLARRCTLCVVFGDVTSTMACAIAARKLGVPVAHVEAGIRSGDWSMPEEINRIVTDSISDYFFTTSAMAGRKLTSSGVRPGRVFFVGNTMIDTLLKHRGRFRRPSFWEKAKLERGNYFVLTLHRPSNVDNPVKLQKLLDTIRGGVRGRTVVFPVHPRTSRTLAQVKIAQPEFIMTEPLSYLEFNYLVEKAYAVVTDSGGISEEATVLGVPCMTLRDSTERPETVQLGTNMLMGDSPARLPMAFARLFAGRWKKGKIPPRWDGKAGRRIAAKLERILGAGE